MDPQPPSGFEPHLRRSAVTDPWQPLFTCEREGEFLLGTFIRPAHCNGREMLHGGVIAALADNAMGIRLAMAHRASFGRDAAPLTTSLSIDYFGVGQPGAWLQIEPRLIHDGKRSGVVDAIVTADGAIIARASASFRMSAG